MMDMSLDTGDPVHVSLLSEAAIMQHGPYNKLLLLVCLGFVSVQTYVFARNLMIFPQESVFTSTIFAA
jgi:hypothetical protein